MFVIINPDFALANLLAKGVQITQRHYNLYKKPLAQKGHLIEVIIAHLPHDCFAN